MELASSPYLERLVWLFGPGQSGASPHTAPALEVDWADISLPPGLTALFDVAELCCWLAVPNSSLDDRAPLDVLENDPDAVLQAARLDRFVAGG